MNSIDYLYEVAYLVGRDTPANVLMALDDGEAVERVLRLAEWPASRTPLDRVVCETIIAQIDVGMLDRE